MIEASAWRIRTGNVEEYLYRVQTENIDLKNGNKLKLYMEGWRNSGDGKHTKSEYYFVIWSKTFKSEEEWDKWLNSFPYPLIEYSSTSDSVKTKINQHLRTERKVRTGGKSKQKQNIKKKSGRTYICQFCCEKGHNRRTCAEYKKYWEQKSKQ